MIEYSKNYLKASGTLWNYTGNVPVDPTTNSVSFKCKTSFTRETTNDENMRGWIFCSIQAS